VTPDPKLSPQAQTTARALLRWYAGNARRLPWRGRKDPYAVWVSEIMLQQTRVEAVIPYYRPWMKRFPRMKDLAAASTDEVLQLWEGLGYYRRALNLLRAAKRLVAQGKDSLPRNARELEQLPGIGRYSAAAISALAFGQDEVAIDGNLQRVLARLVDLRVDPRTPAGERRIRTHAEDLLPRGKAAAFNQALMDLGAMVCLARAPKCGSCPIRSGCLAFARRTQDRRPVRRPKAEVPHRVVGAAVLRSRGKVLIARRLEGRLLGGLWEFPGGKRERGESLAACVRRELREELGITVGVGARLGVFRHAYTHYRVTVHAYECNLARGRPVARVHSAVRWVRPEQLGEFPMGKVDRAIARKLQAAGMADLAGPVGPGVRQAREKKGDTRRYPKRPVT
jgi:A/G-specific adenine glycosylase